MDPRLNQLLEWFDIKPADADVIRNVGTAATEDVVRSLMFSIHVLKVREVMIVGHTGCGMTLFRKKSSKNTSTHNAACGQYLPIDSTVTPT